MCPPQNCTLVFVEWGHLFSAIMCHLIHLYLQEKRRRVYSTSNSSAHVQFMSKDRRTYSALPSDWTNCRLLTGWVICHCKMMRPPIGQQTLLLNQGLLSWRMCSERQRIIHSKSTMQPLLTNELENYRHDLYRLFCVRTICYSSFKPVN